MLFWSNFSKTGKIMCCIKSNNSSYLRGGWNVAGTRFLHCGQCSLCWPGCWYIVYSLCDNSLELYTYLCTFHKSNYTSIKILARERMGGEEVKKASVNNSFKEFYSKGEERNGAVTGRKWGRVKKNFFSVLFWFLKWEILKYVYCVMGSILYKGTIQCSRGTGDNC